MDFSQLSDQELRKRLDEAGMAARVEESEEWGIFREALDRLCRNAQEELLNTSASDTVKIVELQITIKLCRNILKNIIGVVKAEGAIAFQEAKDRNIELL